MKKYLFSILFLSTLLVGQGYAQHTPTMNVIVFSENGERFWLVVNGVRQNNQATQNVKVTALRGRSWQFKVVFENESLGELNKIIYAADGLSREVTFGIGKNRKEEYRFKYYGDIPLDSTPESAEQETVTYHEDELPTSNPAFDLRIGRDGIHVTVNSRGHTNPRSYPNPSNRRTTTTTQQPSSRHTPPCYVPMDSRAFEDVKKSILNKDSEDDRLIVAKQIVRTRCLSSSQMLAMAKIFDFEASRLDFAKFAYDYTTDPQNYYLVNEAFDFSESIRMLDEYIQSKN